MDKPFNLKLFLSVFVPLQFLALGYITYSHYEKNYQVCEIHDISNIDTSKLYKFYKIDSLALFVRDLKFDTLTVYDDSGKCYLQVTIVCPITSKKETKISSLYKADDILMMYLNEDYSFVEKFGPTYAWFGFSFQSEIISDTLMNNNSKEKSKIIQGAISAYSNMVASDSNNYFTREKDANLIDIYSKMINDSAGRTPVVLRFTYNPYETPPQPFNILSLFK